MSGANVKTILVIDDEIDLIKLICIILERHGYVTCSARDGVEGLHALEACQPDLILSNITMPNMNGLEMLRQIKNEPQYADYANTPFAFISARGQPADIKAGLDAGADAYITKPLPRPSELIELISHLLK